MIEWIKKHKVSTILLILIPLFIGWVIWGNTHIETNPYTIHHPEIPESFNGYKIAQVSDLHNKDFGDQLINRLAEAQPDIIAVTGDLLDSRKTNLPVAITFIEEASNLAPIYFVTGNHEARIPEYTTLVEAIQDKVIMLDNQETQLHEGNDTIRLLGLQDPAFLSSNTEPRLQALTMNHDGYKVLLSHRPELFGLYKKYNINLSLSGHAHGGQFRLPFIGGLMAPNQGFLPEYTEGLYSEEETNMVVSRGLGNSLFPFRVNNPPELVIITLSNEIITEE